MTREEKLPPGVYRRKDSKSLWVHYGYRGRDYRESAETNSPKKAAALRDIRKAELRMGKFVQPTARRVMLSELYANVLEDYRINHYASIEDLEDRWVKHLQPFFGHMAAAEVTRISAKGTSFGARRREWLTRPSIARRRCLSGCSTWPPNVRRRKCNFCRAFPCSKRTTFEPDSWKPRLGCD